MTPDTPAATLTGFERAFAELEQTLKAISARDLTEIRDPAGWSAKDHLMHVARWEQALLAKVDGRPRHAALGIDEATDGTGDDDTINAAIFANTRHRPLDEVLKALRETHAETRSRLAAAVDAGSGPDTRGATLLASVPGYTEHYEQHRTWILDLIGPRTT